MLFLFFTFIYYLFVNQFEHYTFLFFFLRQKFMALFFNFLIKNGKITKTTLHFYCNVKLYSCYFLFFFLFVVNLLFLDVTASGVPETFLKVHF